MGWRGTVVLALLAAAVGAYLWFAAPPSDPRMRGATLLGEPRLVEPDKGQSLLEFDPADVIAVQMEHHQKSLEATRGKEAWLGVRNSAAIADLLTNLGTLGRVLEIPAVGADLREYGLHQPESILQLRLRARDTPLVLEIGDRNPATTGVYVRVNREGPVVLAGALVSWEFDKAFRALQE